jgi:hypothetical protein
MVSPIDRRVWIRAAATAAAVVLAAAGGAPAQFIRVADTSTAVPNGTGTYQSFLGMPAVSGSAVVFFGSATGRDGVYVGTAAGGPIVPVAVALQTTAPNTGGGLFNYLSYASTQSVSGTAVAFPGQFGGGSGGAGHGVYTGPTAGGALTRVADSSMTMPGATWTFAEFGATAASGPVVAFGAGNGQSFGNALSGVYTGTTAGGPLARVADTTTPAPNGTVFSLFGSPSVSGSVVAFQGGRPAVSYTGVFAGTAAGGTLTTVADVDTAVPGGTGTFRRFGDAAVSGSRVAFAGGNAQTDGVYIGSAAGGPLTVVANRSTAIPGGGGTFQTFDDPAISGSVIAFAGAGAGAGAPKGIYYIDTDGGPLTELIRVGDTLDGRTVSQLFFGNGGLDGSTLVFAADFTDNTSGVYAVRLTPVPESATVLAIGAVGVGTLRRWRRARSPRS